MEEILKKLHFKNIKGLTLVIIISVLCLYFLFKNIPEGDRFILYILLIGLIGFIIYRIVPSQEIIIRKGSKVKGSVSQELSSEKMGKQKTEIEEETEIEEGVSQK
ncbi:hypothetical protein O8C80_01170 [Aliarcobacter butzleri]|uniref:hypothetical protein n=1 Tax=Aliarcobacter butzleri TaxID=28197 RepID=UPI00263C5B3E|nr:hypothetical protein [Aliarcobacter butzleri]MDN5041933.1 hypothetical protein [Aliarcobacter butzleri]